MSLFCILKIVKNFIIIFHLEIRRKHYFIVDFKVSFTKNISKRYLFVKINEIELD